MDILASRGNRLLRMNAENAESERQPEGGYLRASA